MTLPEYKESYLVADGDSEGAGTYCYQKEDGTYMMATIWPNMTCSTYEADGMYAGMGGEQMSAEAEVKRWASEFDVTIKEI